MRRSCVISVVLIAMAFSGACTKLNDPAATSDLAVGRLDTTFNGTGLVVLGNTAGTDFGRGIDTDSAGNIIAVSARTVTGNGFDMAAFRFTPSGGLDTNFNGTGLLTVDGSAGLANQTDSPFRVLVDGNDRLLVTGDAWNGSDYDMIVWRVTATGALDTTFDTDGILQTNGGAYDTGRQVLLDGQSRIMVASVRSAGGNQDMASWRINDDGTLDTAYDTDGWFIDDTGSNDWAKDGALDGIDRMVVVGSLGNDLVLWRVAVNGGLDAAFGTAGRVTYTEASAILRGEGVAIDAQGRIIVVGWRLSGGNYDAMVWRFDSSGTLDTSFGNNGVVALDSGGRDIAWDVELDSEGNIVVCGEWFNGNDKDMIVWRFRSDGSADDRFGQDDNADNTPDGYVIHADAAGTGDDIAYRLALDGQGRILVIGDSDASGGANTDRDVVIWRFE